MENKVALMKLLLILLIPLLLAFKPVPHPETGFEMLQNQNTLQYNSRFILPVTNTWEGYKESYIACGLNCGTNLGLVFDPGIGYQAVSEGVGYGMLMAVMMNDQSTFDTIYDAAHLVMIDSETGLFHWRIGPDSIITGFGSATDAELDIALALIFATARVNAGEWAQHPSLPYNVRANTLLDSVWEYQVVEGRYLKPGDRFGGEGREIINLSYFAPAWFRIYNDFQQTDRWSMLIDQGYQSLYSTEGSDKGLAPDWSTVDGRPAYDYCDANERSRNLCRYEMWYDAIRVPWRIGIDCMWFQEERACEWSRRSMAFMQSLSPERRARMYDMQGEVIVDYQDLTMLGMWSVAAMAAESPLRNQLETQLLAASAQSANTGYWGDNNTFYYNQSLAWFGAATLSGTFRNMWPGG